MPRPPRRLGATHPIVALVTAVIATALLAACSSGSRSGVDTSPEPTPPSYPDVSGTWVGGIMVEGQTIDGTLALTQDGSDLTGVFSAPDLGVSAEGGGTISAEGELRMVLQYDVQCPGTAEMIGSRSSDGDSLSGMLQAEDCTGRISGSFDFRR